MNLASTRVGGGYRPSPIPIPCTRPFSRSSLVGVAPLPASFDLRDVMAMPDVRDQNPFDACVGEARAAAINVATVCKYRRPSAYPSPLGIYTVARDREIARIGIAIADIGCNPGDATTGLLEWGVFSEKRWELSQATINAPLPWDALEHAQKLNPDDVQPIVSGGDQRILDIRATIFLRAPPTGALFAGPAFQQLTTDATYEGELGDPDHDLMFAGWRPDAFLMRNSWGRSWGVNGYGWVSNAIVADVMRVMDVIAIAGGPVLEN